MWEQYEVELERKIARLEKNQDELFEAAQKVKALMYSVYFLASDHEYSLATSIIQVIERFAKVSAHLFLINFFGVLLDYQTMLKDF